MMKFSWSIQSGFTLSDARKTHLRGSWNKKFLGEGPDPPLRARLRRAGVPPINFFLAETLPVTFTWSHLWRLPGHTCDVYLVTPVTFTWSHLWRLPGHTCDVYLVTPVTFTWSHLWRLPGHTCDVYLVTPVTFTWSHLWRLPATPVTFTWSHLCRLIFNTNQSYSSRGGKITAIF